MVPAAVLTQSKPVSITAVRPVSATVPKIKVTQPRLPYPIVTKFKSRIKRHITRSPSPETSNSTPNVTVEAPVVSVVKGIQRKWGNPQHALKDKGVIDSGCSRHMTGNMSYLSDFQELNGGYVAFGGNPKGGNISGKGKIKTGKLDFEDVYFVKELKFNLFSVSQICDKKNSVLFTDTECLVLSPDFKLSDDSQVLLRVPRENNMYNINLKNIVPSGNLTYLFAKATIDESNLWHRRLGHINFKTINKLVKGNLVRGLPTNFFENDNTCVACKKGKQHRDSYKTKHVSSIDQTLYRLHMDLFGPTFVKSLNKKSYCIVVTDDYSRKLKGNLVYQAPFSGKEHDFDEDAAFDGKEHDFDAKKPESKVNVSLSSSAQSRKQDDKTKKEAKGKSPIESFTRYRDISAEFEDCSDNSSNEVNAAGSIVPTVGHNSPNKTNTFSATSPSNAAASLTYGKSSFIDASQLTDDMDMPELKDITYSNNENNVGAEADSNNLETSITLSPIPITRVHKDHHVLQIISDLSLTTQTRSMTRVVKDQGELSQMFDDDFHTFDLPYGKRAIGTKWVYRNKKDERGIVIRNKVRLVAQGHTQEEGIDYEEVFALVSRIEAIRLFLAYASFMGFMVYQMDVKSAFLYETIKEEVYVCQLLGFEDPDHLDKVYKVVKAFYGLHQAPRAWYKTLANYLLENSFQRGKIDQTLFIKRHKEDILLVQIYVDDIIFVKQKKDGIFISQDKYVAEILRKFGLTKGKSASTPIDTEKPLLKDPDDEDVDVQTYRSMISLLMYLTSSRPNIMFAVCACARFQMTPKASHLHAVKRIFRYLKGKPHLGLWYPRDSPFDLVAYSDTDYAGASLDRKSTTRGCRFLGCILISWQCKKHTVISTEAEYVAAAS
nr:hypothetical protein [Tanacetum cinerariifolium]